MGERGDVRAFLSGPGTGDPGPGNSNNDERNGMVLSTRVPGPGSRVPPARRAS